MPHHHPDRHTPTQQDPRAVARERLAARSRRLRTLRLRAAGGAVAVFLAAWVALFVPAQQDGTTQTTTQAATPASTQTTTDTDPSAATDESYDSGFVEQVPQTDADTGAAVQAAPATTSQS